MRTGQRLAVLAGLASAAGVSAQVRLAIERIGAPGDFSYPVVVTQPPGETHRLYVASHNGPIRIFKDGATQPADFVDVTVAGGGASEPGLLGFAFHPGFQGNGYCYVCYNGSGPGGLSGIVVRRYTTNPASPDQVIAGADQPVFFAARAAGIHNGGWMSFGPDGYLYISLGDSGNSALAQDLTQPLGKMLRIDVDHDDFPDDSFQNYAIPPTNPLAASPTARRDIWAVGLRNPWRCSFDRLTGDLWIGDVGDASSGEIDRQPAIGPPPYSALNYGWPCMEGNACHSGNGCTCHDPGLTLPVYDEGRQGPATIGGYVYRGSAIPELQGTYIFGDYGGAVWSFRYDGAGGVTEFVRRDREITGLSFSAFGEDGAGELYLCSLPNSLYRIIRGCYANCDSSPAQPILNVNDFVCFLNQFAAGDPRANCDASTQNPVLNAVDFVCFLNAFAAGCS